MNTAGAVAVLALVGAAVLEFAPGDGGPRTPVAAQEHLQEQLPSTPARDFFSAFEVGDARRASLATDSPEAAAPAITRVKEGMAPARLRVVVADAEPPHGNEAELSAEVTWTLPDGTPLAYRVRVPVHRSGERWLLRWSPSLLHPELPEGGALVHRSTTGEGGLRARTGERLTPDLAPALRPALTQATGPLEGSTGWQIGLVDASDAQIGVLAEKPARSETMTTTLDPAAQRSAQAALASTGHPAALVALQPSTGEVLAIAQSPLAGPNLALVDHFEPGSTFKVVTAAAALTTGGLTASTPLPCPGEATIGTRTITNDGGFDLGTVPLRRAFAASCNTTFGKLAADLPATALQDAAARFGLGADYDVPGLTTNTGKVPPAESVPERVEAGIGQGRVQVTPFGMALLAATVANGSTPTPKLVRELETTGGGHPAPSPAVVTALRAMMADVVTSGTARALSAHGDVRGKTGTAQFGDGTGAHGWFVGYRGDVAFAVLVVGGGSSEPAVRITGEFLGGL
ncbi:penicillin-binding transpeptidase domain-containing protein [Actinosynnema pretiosum subsp. pretiosum]